MEGWMVGRWKESGEEQQEREQQRGRQATPREQLSCSRNGNDAVTWQTRRHHLDPWQA
jgi:hypothetical protein